MAIPSTKLYQNTPLNINNCYLPRGFIAAEIYGVLLGPVKGHLLTF
jgi:hypothetical protein